MMFLNGLDYVYAIYSIVFLLTLFVCISLVPLAKRIGLVASPGGHRLHSRPTPLVGGIAIVVGVLVGIIGYLPEHTGIIPSLLVLSVIGIFDDLYDLHSIIRLIAHIASALLMIEFSGVKLESLGNIFSETEMILGSYAVPLTIFSVVGVINATNMSDGSDGLVGSITLLSLISLLVMGTPDSEFATITISAILGFLFWNLRLFRNTATVFIGDVGTATLGIIIAYLLINSSQTGFHIHPVSALWIFGIPLIDAVSVMAIRPLKGRSPFSADRIHYHHHLLLLNLGVNKTLLLILVLQGGFIVTGYILSIFQIAEYIQFYLFLAVFLSYFCYLLKTSN